MSSDESKSSGGVGQLVIERAPKEVIDEGKICILQEAQGRF